MGLRFFRAEPISIATMIGLNDYATGDGSETDFDIVNKTYTSLANVVQAGSAFYRRSSTPPGVTSVDADTVHLISAPAMSTPIVFPDSVHALMVAFDTAVPGEATPQEDTIIVHIADIADIDTQSYEAIPSAAGILVYLTDRIPGVGAADLDWFQFAPLDADMEIGTYGDFGDPLELANPIHGFSTLDVDADALDDEIELVSATDFYEGQWLRIITGDDMDVVWVVDITGTTLTLSQPLSYAHPAGTSVFACGTGLAIHCEIPDDASGGIAKNLFNLSLDQTSEINPR